MSQYVDIDREKRNKALYKPEDRPKFDKLSEKSLYKHMELVFPYFELFLVVSNVYKHLYNIKWRQRFNYFFRGIFDFII